MKIYKVWVKAQVEEYDYETDEFRNVVDVSSDPHKIEIDEGMEEEEMVFETESAAEAFAFAEQLIRNLDR